MEKKHNIIFIFLVIFVNLLATGILVDYKITKHEDKYIHFESMYTEDGYFVAYPNSKGLLRATQYVEFYDEYNKETDYKHTERVILYRLPVYSLAATYTRTTNGGLNFTNKHCYYNQSIIDCNEIFK